MTLKALAHTAHQTLQARAGCHIRHGHVHELLAAAFGYRSRAALNTDALLADHGLGLKPEAASAGPQIAGRALQMQYRQAEAMAMADALGEFIANRQLGVVRWSTLLPPLSTPPESSVFDRQAENDEMDGRPDDRRDTPAPSPTSAVALPGDQILASDLLLEGLERAATKDPRVHQLLATLYRCKKPNSYLYEESLKGRVLGAIERRWVDEYLQLQPRYLRYEAHLKAAAQGGVRAAALEYGTVFEQPEFIALAERLERDANTEETGRVDTSFEERTRQLYQAADAGSRRALEELADLGDPWAEERMAPMASENWLRGTAEFALAGGDPVRAWVWQYVALARGHDLTQSRLTARHDGGSRDGAFYDSDFGGPLYVDGHEALVLPPLDHLQHEKARATAAEILRR